MTPHLTPGVIQFSQQRTPSSKVQPFPQFDRLKKNHKLDKDLHLQYTPYPASVIDTQR